MQVNPQEVSGAEATTPGQRERFEAAYAAEYNQLRGTDITASDIAGMRDGDWYGDRAYLNGWWRGWQMAEVRPAGWTNTKPTQPGAYWVRGNGLERPALIQVQAQLEQLWCNLHMCNTEPDFDFGYSIEQLSDTFEWFGPLSPSPASGEDPSTKFLATLQEAKGIALHVFDGSHDDAKQAIEYIVEVLKTSAQAKQGGAV
ncbi:hypothetical protein IB239_01810 [Pseudomonas sp. PDM12]|uniref:hypothetical protein n=1 Tax=Pseudomonas sp. PDM12 TaxID=2769260 RepID=UPI0017856B06|nr:hypothetical protein [Pseudomonas sp. PDM12]MBD9653546.1 hypothetical protein [Pseudomonas sp. PDM12]